MLNKRELWVLDNEDLFFHQDDPMRDLNLDLLDDLDIEVDNASEINRSRYRHRAREKASSLSEEWSVFLRDSIILTRLIENDEISDLKVYGYDSQEEVENELFHELKEDLPTLLSFLSPDHRASIILELLKDPNNTEKELEQIISPVERFIDADPISQDLDSLDEEAQEEKDKADKLDRLIHEAFDIEIASKEEELIASTLRANGIKVNEAIDLESEKFRKIIMENSSAFRQRRKLQKTAKSLDPNKDSAIIKTDVLKAMAVPDSYFDNESRGPKRVVERLERLDHFNSKLGTSEKKGYSGNVQNIVSEMVKQDLIKDNSDIELTEIGQTLGRVVLEEEGVDIDLDELKEDDSMYKYIKKIYN